MFQTNNIIYPEFPSQNKKLNFVWRKEWIEPFESPWGIFEKFKFANEATVNDIMYLFGNQYIKNKKLPKWTSDERELLYMRNLDPHEIQSILSISVQDLNKQYLNQIIKILPNPHDIRNYVKSELRVCGSCIKSGYHSILHQFALLDVCPIHLTPLISECPNCKNVYTYELNDTGFEKAFQCKCGHSFIDEPNDTLFFFKLGKDEPS